MANTHVIPGYVGTTEARILLITEALGVPVVSITGPRPQLAPTDLKIIQVRSNPRFEQALEGVQLWSIAAHGLEENTRYALGIRIGRMTREISVVTQDSKARSFDIVLASCFWHGANRSGAYEQVLMDYGKRAAFKLLMGDNLYVDIPLNPPGDANHVTARSYLQHFFEGKYRDVLAAGPTLTTWDDHEFWNNFPEEQAWLRRSKPPRDQAWAEAGRAGIQSFQAVLNPEPADQVQADGEKRGGSFSLNDTPLVSWFVADIRTQRTHSPKSLRKMMTEADLRDLEKWASTLSKPGVLALGQPLMMTEGGGTDYNPPRFRKQYTRIVRAIKNAPYDILVLSGDVHHSRVLLISLGGQRYFHEVVSSPASHIPSSLAVFFNRTRSQSSNRVAFPSQARTDDPAMDLRVEKYLLGTGEPNTIATLEFRGSPSSHHGISGAVDVTVRFRDLLKGGRPAKPQTRIRPRREREHALFHYRGTPPVHKNSVTLRLNRHP